MHIRTLFIALVLALPFGVSAQAVQRCCGTSNSTFLLGNTSFAPHTQSLYLPGDLQNEVSGLITTLYFRYGNTGEDLGNTLTGLMIRLGTTTATAFAGAAFFTDLDTVLMAPSYFIAPGTEGNWFSIPLQTPFAYDASQTLILDIWFTASATTNFGTLGTNNNGRKLYSLTLDAPTGTSTSSTWQDIGFDVEVGTGLRDATASGVRVLPLPGHAQVQLLRTTDWADDVTVRLHDVSGKPLHSTRWAAGSTTHLLDLQGHAAGVYLITLHSADGAVRYTRFVKGE
jgi:hypothetical protein